MFVQLYGYVLALESRLSSTSRASEKGVFRTTSETPVRNARTQQHKHDRKLANLRLRFPVPGFVVGKADTDLARTPTPFRMTNPTTIHPRYGGEFLTGATRKGPLVTQKVAFYKYTANSIPSLSTGKCVVRTPYVPSIYAGGERRVAPDIKMRWRE